MTSSAFDHGWVVAINLFTDREWLGKGEYHPVEVARLSYRSHVIVRTNQIKVGFKIQRVQSSTSSQEAF